MKRVMLICWGYVVELALAAIVYGLLLFFFGAEKVAAFLSNTWGAWSTVCGVVLAVAVSMFVVVLQMLTSDFGGYLVSRSADGPFRKAFGTAVAISFAGTIAFIIAGNIKWAPATHAAGVLLLLVAINLYSMMKNAMNLQRMHALFERIRRREQQDEHEGRK